MEKDRINSDYLGDSATEAVSIFAEWSAGGIPRVVGARLLSMPGSLYSVFRILLRWRRYELRILSGYATKTYSRLERLVLTLAARITLRLDA